MHQASEFGLMSCSGLRKHLLELAARRRQRNSHGIGSALEPLAARDRNSRLRLTIGKIKSLPHGIHIRIAARVGIADEKDAICHTARYVDRDPARLQRK